MVDGAGQVSPDGNWLAYESKETDGTAWDIYVQSLTVPGDEKWRVTTDWGANPRWSRDGREIFYHARDGRLMSVAVSGSAQTLKIERPVPLFEATLLGGTMPVVPLKQQYDVSKDGRFLLNLPVGTATEHAFNVVVNWTAEPKR